MRGNRQEGRRKLHSGNFCFSTSAAEVAGDLSPSSVKRFTNHLESIGAKGGGIDELLSIAKFSKPTKSLIRLSNGQHDPFWFRIAHCVGNYTSFSLKPSP